MRDLGPSLGQLDDLLERTSAGARSVEGTLRLGIFSAPAGGPRLVEIIRGFEALHSSSTVEVVQMSWDDPFEGVRTGEVHVMATWLPVDQPDLVVGPVLTSQPRALAVAHDHPLAGRESVDFEELADHRLLRFDNWPKKFHEAISPSRTPSGRPIPRAPVPVGERSVSDVAVRVARGEVVYPTVASATTYMGDLTFIPVAGMPAPSQRPGVVAARRATPSSARSSRSRAKCSGAASADYLTVRVPFIPCCSWSPTGQ